MCSAARHQCTNTTYTGSISKLCTVVRHPRTRIDARRTNKGCVHGSTRVAAPKKKKYNVVSWAIGARRTAIVGWCAMGDIEGPATVVRQQVASGFIACETQNTGRGATGT